MDLIRDNFWIDHFNKEKMKKKENWIDFENEISNVIQSIDEHIKDNPDISINNCIITNIKDFIPMNFSTERKTYAEFRDKLLKDLNNFIRCFEIYLAEFVEKIHIDAKFDTQNICYNPNNIKVISFNYTHTFQKFNRKERIDYHYIHGEAKIDNTVENNNMVLGIGEYLEGEAKNKEIDFIAFKKYYQRILKQTGNKYRNWLKDTRGILSINNYIIGHSLDITDKDILKDLILHDKSTSNTTIYYYNKNDLEKKIANLVKIIGQEELIKRTGEDNIIFKNQEEIYIEQINKQKRLIADVLIF